MLIYIDIIIGKYVKFKLVVCNLFCNFFSEQLDCACWTNKVEFVVVIFVHEGMNYIGGNFFNFHSFSYIFFLSSCAFLTIANFE